MRAIDLDTESPRAADIVEAYTRECARRTRKLARGISSWFVLTAVFMSVAFMIIARDDLAYALWASLLSLVILGGLTSFVVSTVIMGDVRTARRLVRDAPAHRGGVVRDVALSYKTLHIVDVAWDDGGRTRSARFTIPESDLNGKDDVIVLAGPADYRVAAAFGNRGVFVGRRARS